MCYISHYLQQQRKDLGEVSFLLLAFGLKEETFATLTACDAFKNLHQVNELQVYQVHANRYASST